MIKVKICGINDPVAFDTAVEAGADWVGFNFFPPSPRFVTPETAATLSGRSAEGPSRVGLFVDPTVQEVESVLETIKLDILQIYGTIETLETLKARFALPIWRPVGIRSVTDLPIQDQHADRLLLEAKPPAGATRPGGNATTFDWAVLQGWSAPAPWMLAGGLTPENVAAAIRVTGAKAVDVSSGVETRKGAKDPSLIRAFITAAKAADP